MTGIWEAIRWERGAQQTVIVNGNLAIPIFCRKGYDGSLAGRAIKARLGLENLMTLTWENGLDLAEIV